MEPSEQQSHEVFISQDSSRNPIQDEKSNPTDDEPNTEQLKLQRTESTFEYPPTSQAIVVMIAIMLAMFLVALVSTMLGLWTGLISI